MSINSGREKDDKVGFLYSQKNIRYVEETTNSFYRACTTCAKEHNSKMESQSTQIILEQCHILIRNMKYFDPYYQVITD